MGFFLDEEDSSVANVTAPSVAPTGFFLDESKTPPTTPSLFQNPINALTSADWWLTRPSGERISTAQAVAGPAVKALDALTFGAGDEIAAAGASLIGGGNYDDYLSTARGAQQSLEKASPVGSLALSLAGGLKAPVPNVFSKAKGIAPALRNVAKAGALGTGYGGISGFLSGEGEGRIDSAVGGAKLGGILGTGAGVVGESAAPVLASIGNKIEDALVGYNPSLKDKIAKFLNTDEQVVRNAVDDGSQVGFLQQKVKDLRDTGFHEKTGFFESPASVANRVSKLKSDSGADIGNVINKAQKVENSMLKDISKGQAGFYKEQKGAPIFENAIKYVREIANVSPSKARPLITTLNDTYKAWQRSDKSISALKKLQEKFGAIHKSSFKPNLSDTDELARKFNGEIYKSLAQALETRVEGLGKWATKSKTDTSFIEEFKEANKTYSAAKALEQKSFDASKKFGGAGAIKEILNPLKGGAAAGATYFIPGAAPYLIAERIGSAAIKGLPVQSAKTLKGASKLLSGLEKESALIGYSAGQAKAKKSKTPMSSPFTLSDLSSEAQAAETPQVKKLEIAASKPTKITAITPDIVEKVVQAESNGNHRAIGPKTKYGHAKGLMQLLDPTAKEVMKKMGLDPDKWSPFDKKLNKKVGTKYLETLAEKYDGNVIKALVAYNWGPGNLDKFLAGKLKFIPKETQNYVNKIVGKNVFV